MSPEKLIALITIALGTFALMIWIILTIITERANRYVPKHLRACPCKRCQRS